MKLKELWIWRFIVLVMGTMGGVCVCVQVYDTLIFAQLCFGSLNHPADLQVAVPCARF